MDILKFTFIAITIILKLTLLLVPAFIPFRYYVRISQKGLDGKVRKFPNLVSQFSGAIAGAFIFSISAASRAGLNIYDIYRGNPKTFHTPFRSLMSEYIYNSNVLPSFARLPFWSDQYYDFFLDVLNPFKISLMDGFKQISKIPNYNGVVILMTPAILLGLGVSYSLILRRPVLPLVSMFSVSYLHMYYIAALFAWGGIYVLGLIFLIGIAMLFYAMRHGRGIITLRAGDIVRIE